MTGALGPRLAESLSKALGTRVAGLQPVGGGDVDCAFSVALPSGERLFAKASGRGGAGEAARFQREADGLAWLSQPGVVAVPQVRACLADPPALVLEWIEPGTGASEESLGRGLASLHAAGAPGFGGVPDNFIGPLPQSNRSHSSWPRFYAEQRVAPQVAAARDAGSLSAEEARRFDGLCARMESCAGPDEPPSRLHGDLWNGNVVRGADGRSWLVDPAAYGGHREVDLSMMQLFGGFGARCFDAYAEASPLAPGWRERVPLYQLYPLLVHLNLFGGGYRGRALAALDRLT